VLHGAQPLRNPAGTHALAVNGEIYNHRALRAALREPYAFATESDCEVILALYRERGADFLGELQGMFAFVLYDAEADRYLVARDHMGIVPLYTGRDAEGRLYVASEMKALVPVCTERGRVPARGTCSTAAWARRCATTRRRGATTPRSRGRPPTRRPVRRALEASVRAQMMSDVPYGVLLSAGSTRRSSPRARSASPRGASRTTGARARGGRGCTRSPWASTARPTSRRRASSADHVGTVHHEFHFTVQEGLDALSDVIHHLETYDVTTVRASTPMYLMARRIRATGVKMVLSGEGADEVFGGYLYFHRAPDARAFHEETVRKLDRLHWFDCLRANKSMAAWGVEARVPFLDQRFLDVAMRIDPAAKMTGAAAWRSRSSATPSPTCSPRPSSDARRSSSRTGWATTGSTRCGRTPRRRSPTPSSRRPRSASVQPAAHQGGVLLPHALRRALPARGVRRVRARREVGGVQHPRGARVGPVAGRGDRSVGAGGAGGAPGGVLAAHRPRAAAGQATARRAPGAALTPARRAAAPRPTGWTRPASPSPARRGCAR
jgi:hypothetical protein